MLDSNSCKAASQGDDKADLSFIYFYCPSTGRVLVEHRLCDHTYGLPGGGVDEGEAAMHAAIREAEEETGYKADPAQVVPLCAYHDGWGRRCHVSVIVVDEEFEAKVTGHDLPPLQVGQTLKNLFCDLYSGNDKIHFKESHGFQWVKPQDWPEPMHPATPMSLKSLMTFINYDRPEDKVIKACKSRDRRQAISALRRSINPA